MFLGQASTRDPKFRANPALYGDQILILMAAYTIAAAPNPEVGLLDMVVLTTLGRMIYEAHWGKQYGDLVQPAIVALRILETDIWRIATKALTAAEQTELRGLIKTWRRTHPQQVAFAFMRFSPDYSPTRKMAQKSCLSPQHQAVSSALQVHPNRNCSQKSAFRLPGKPRTSPL